MELYTWLLRRAKSRACLIKFSTALCANSPSVPLPSIFKHDGQEPQKIIYTRRRNYYANVCLLLALYVQLRAGDVFELKFKNCIFLSLSVFLFVDEHESLGCKTVGQYLVLSALDSRSMQLQYRKTTFGYDLSLHFLTARCFPKSYMWWE